MDVGFATVRDEDPRPWLEIRRTLQRRQQGRKSRWLLELIGIVLVLFMSIATAWWVGSDFAIDLSGLSATVVALAPPRHEPEHRIVGYTGLAGDPPQAPVSNQRGATGT